MTKKATKKLSAELQEKFEREFPGKRLLAVHLDGFSHSVVYDDGTAKSPIKQADSSMYMSDAEARLYEDDEDRACRNFLKAAGFTSHMNYQNNALEILLVDPEDR